MGLAPYGEPKYKDIILENLIDLKNDGTFKLNMKYFNYYIDKMINAKFVNLFGKPIRKPESELTQHEMDIARSIQEVAEEIILRLATTIRNEFDVDHLCLGGGVALNCVANGKIMRENIFKDIWIQPAAGDSGSAIGAAYAIWHEYLDQPRILNGQEDKMQGTYLGPSFDNQTIKTYLNSQNAIYIEHDDNELTTTVAALLAEDNVVGWFQGRMEFGPRALGNRSILGDPRNLTTQSKMNLKIKFRESFRPFAPVVMAEYSTEYFDLKQQSPYMLLVAPIVDQKRKILGEKDINAVGLNKLKVCRSEIPAVTHVDYSARVQTMEKEINPLFYQLLSEFHKKTGCPVLVNTSFNIRGEPIVCTPQDAYQCFLRTDMDYLVMGNIILDKNKQPIENIAKSKEILYEKD
jgi:carbamoyltransferase